MSDTSHSPSTDDAPPAWDALARHYAGEGDPDEARLVAGWLAAHPADAAMLAALHGAAGRALAPAVDGDEPDVEVALRRVKARRDAADAAPAPRVLPFRRPQPASRRRAWLAGGGLAAAAAGALIALTMDHGLPADRAAGVAAVAQAAGPGAEVVTAVGVLDTAVLADGSRVILAPGSRLVVAAGYGDGVREVTLEGAALFTVRHDEARPFAVRAGRAVVRDLGTVFAVRTDGVRGGPGVAVVVTEGRVALGTAGGADSGVVLDAGDRGELRGDRAAPTAERGGAGAGDVAWAGGRLVFRDATLETVGADLRRWYGIRLRVADPALADRRLTATFTNETPARVLDAIALSLGAELVRTGDEAVLRRAGSGGR